MRTARQNEASYFLESGAIIIQYGFRFGVNSRGSGSSIMATDR